ncbi:MAG: glutamine--tRNA ligase/YqeY domain fusion protein [Eubacteriales bacterium]
MPEEIGNNFIHEIIDADLESGRISQVVTRFPPEPNGYLHIGHAKAINLNFSTAIKYGGKCFLRFDDTNPAKEDDEYIQSIKKDITWLGFEWEEIRFASDYFEFMYEMAVRLIKKGLAYVCDLTAEEMRDYRGTLTEPGKNSPYRERSVDENLKLFEEMRAGKYADGEKVLRAKIDMASPNLNMRDPIIYRILRATHHRTGDDWLIYPMYDYAHPLGDAMEKITHSICTLEFEDHRPLYDWVIDNTDQDPKPHQYEFARLNLTQTIMSKRYLKKLVDEKVVDGWDDPRMPTLSGLRRRGYTPEAIRDFCQRIGISKANSEVDVKLLEHCVREDLNSRALRRMAVLEPLLLEVVNYPEGESEVLVSSNHPMKPEAGKREMTFSKYIYIEQADFMENPPGKFFRLAPGREVRLMNAYIIKYEDVVKDEDGNILKVLVSYDKESKTGGATAGRKVKGTLHWVDKGSAVKGTVRQYDYLLNPAEGNEKVDFMERLNEDSLKVYEGVMLEPAIKTAEPGQQFQLMRQGYYACDIEEFTPENPVMNLIVGLRDSYAKAMKK